MKVNQAEVVQLCRALVALVDDPHLGLSTWNIACADTVRELTSALQGGDAALRATLRCSKLLREVSLGLHGVGGEEMLMESVELYVAQADWVHPEIKVGGGHLTLAISHPEFLERFNPSKRYRITIDVEDEA